jgi:osmoprotectant transport system permease protein
VKRSLVSLSLLVVALGNIGACTSRDVPFELRVGSKKFTESVILGELAVQLLHHEGFRAVHRAELGGTRVLWNALLKGEIDAYPEYTGTVTQEILAGELGAEASLGAIRAALAPHGVGVSRPLGFNNTYALGMREAQAAQLGIRSVSQLRQHPQLRFGFGNEFMDRHDGWPGLRQRYRLPQTQVRGLDHDLAYRGLSSGGLDVTDLYSTDAEIRYYELRVLEDDLGYFPRYEAVWLWRADVEARAVAALRHLEGRINAARMTAMNARAKLDRIPASETAAEFLARELQVVATLSGDSPLRRLGRRTREHLFLVAVSLGAAIALAVPVGVLAAKRQRLGPAILGVTGVIQTIPSLALLVFMIPLLGIGAPPAIAALFLYSLLPIVRNTHAGLHDIPTPLRESAEALGLPPAARLLRIELPLAGRAILAGIKTSAVINVGTATLGALIGAGGYGQPILTGIRLDDVSLILEGAIPAAALALLAQASFDGLEHAVVPKGLRLAPDE